MSMDLLVIEAVVGELRQRLRGAAVARVHQPGPAEIVLRLWNGRETLRLLLSASPRASRIHLTAARLANPQAPPRFCQLLRARLTRLLEIEQVAGDRVVRLRFAGEGEECWTLVAELFGPRADLLLLDGQGMIVDALHRRQEEGRRGGPGQPYAPPAVPRRFDLAAGVPEIPAGVPLRSWLLEAVTPMTALLAEDLALAVARGMSPEQALARFRARWLAREFTPVLGNRGQQPVFSAFSPECLALDSARSFASPSQAADAFYAGLSRQTAGGGRGEMERVVRRGIVRLERRLANIEAEAVRARDGERQRQLGDLLLANLHRLRRGMAEVVLADWYADPPAEVTIPLDPALSPQENAEGCFRRHRKAKRALEHIDRRRLETAADLEWLEGVSLALEEAAGPAELAAVRDELVEAGLLPHPFGPGRRPGPVPAEAGVRRTTSPGGFAVLWGRNNRGNDLVSRRLAGPDDLWFHAQGVAGCHLVLQLGGRKAPVPEADLLFAAALAAGYSRGKDAGKAEVMVTQGRWVRKPKGARPGLVTVERYRTVVVRPLRVERDLPQTPNGLL